MIFSRLLSGVWLTLQFVILVESVDVKCDFFYRKWENLDRVYTCSVKDLRVTTPYEVVTSVTGIHDHGVRNIDVEKLNIENEVCFYLPSGFENFFPNLKGLRISTSSLMALRQSTLMPFPKLLNCDIHKNLLTTLDADLFEKNSKLEYLYFGRNYIKQVGRDVLSPLKNIKKANFEVNDCINFIAMPEEISTLQNQLNVKCPMNETVASLSDKHYYCKIMSSEKSSNAYLWIVLPLFLLIGAGIGFFLARHQAHSPTPRLIINNQENVLFNTPTTPVDDDGGANNLATKNLLRS